MMDNLALFTWGFAAILWLTFAAWVLSASLIGFYGLRSLFRRLEEAQASPFDLPVGRAASSLPSD